MATSSWGPALRAVYWRTGCRPTPRLPAGGGRAGPSAGDPYTGGVHQTVSAATTRTTARPGSRSCRSGRSIGRVQDPWRLSSLIGRRAHVGIALTMTVGQNSAFLAACTELRPHRLGELNEPDRSAPSPVPSTAGCGTGPRTGTCVPSGGDPPDRPPGAYAQRILLDGCRATGVEYRDGAGLNPASDRLPRGDTQRRPLS